MIRTIIVDDEILSGVGIQSLIDGVENIKVAGVFGGPEEAMVFLKENAVDIVITDIEMADMNGLEFIKLIREQQLSDGVIILSCHDDFSYAQEAISRGTDSYLLKYNISRELLVGEIKKVYEKTHRERLIHPEQTSLRKDQRPITGDELYVIGVVQLKESEEGRVDSSMLVHLLERVVSRYDMGTVFSPYNRKIFIIFQFLQDTPAEVRRETLRTNLEVICENIRQYINSSPVYGLSREFTDLKQAQERYEEGVAALEGSFYEPGKTVYFYRKPWAKDTGICFSQEYFLEADGMERFRRELSGCLRDAGERQMPVPALKSQVGQAVGRLVDRVLQKYSFNDTLVRLYVDGKGLFAVLEQTEDAGQMEEQICEWTERFRGYCLEALDEDAFLGVMDYIEQNLGGKLSLPELSEMACMSVSSFSKKFKERTNLTLVQYLNVRRIEQAKRMLKDRSLTLEEIAEETGFSNANYLIRVFKKVTGQTISEYRK